MSFYWTWFHRLSSLPPKLKFRKSRLIRVTPAADPSDLLWENLDAPRTSPLFLFQHLYPNIVFLCPTSLLLVTLLYRFAVFHIIGALVKLRRFGTLCATAVVVVVCFLIILVRMLLLPTSLLHTHGIDVIRVSLQLAQNARKEFAAKVPNLSKCTQDVPALLIRGCVRCASVLCVS